MQSSKEKVKDAASAAKEKVKEFTGKAGGKAESATARTPEGRAAAEERGEAREKAAKAEYHEKKAEHRDQAAADRGTTHVPLVGEHHHRPVGADPTYPSAGAGAGAPTGEKYL